MFALSLFSGPDYPGAWNRLSQTQYVSTCFYIILHLLILRNVAFYRVYIGKKLGKIWPYLSLGTCQKLTVGEGGWKQREGYNFLRLRKGRGHEKWAVKRGRVMQI